MEFGRRRFKDTKAPRNLSFAERLVRICAYIVSAIAVVALLIAIVSPLIEPSQGGILPILGLVAPAIYIGNLILALYWIIYWRWRVVTPIIIVLVIGGFFSTLYIKIPLTKDYDTKSYRGCIKVMSYNVRLFRDDAGRESGKEVAEYMEGVKPDLICLQEYNSGVATLFDKSTTTISKYNRVTSADLAIITRYPIISSSILNSDDERSEHGYTPGLGHTLIADIVVGADTLRVFNNHLHSTTITAKDNKYLTSSMIVRDTNRNDNTINILAKYKNSCERRSLHVDKISAQIANSPYPTIVCGDFNDPPASHTYFKMRRGLKDSFQECGSDYSYTYRGFFNALRIDYILCSKQLTPESYSADREIIFSDHLPVVAHLRIKRK